jgi:hypothetical protein
MVKHGAVGLVLLVLLSACQQAPAVPTPIGPVTRPDLVSLINWERSPLAVVFRAEAATSDATAFPSRTEIADCTIYGDNRVVFTAPTGLGSAVHWQRVSDEAIRLFVEDLTVNYTLYNYSAGVDAMPADERPTQTDAVMLVVNGQAHRADAFGGWPDDYYRLVAERCRAVATEPALLIPAAAYVSVEPVVYDENLPRIEWDSTAGIDLAALGAERHWLSGPALQALWNAQRESGAAVQFRQAETDYRVAVEVPGVTRFSPPPP